MIFESEVNMDGTVHRFLMTGLAGAILLGVALTTSAQSYEEGKYKVVDTGVEQTTLYGTGLLGAWLNNEKIVLNALQDRLDAQEKRLDRVVIYDVKANTVTTLIPAGRVVCFNEKERLARISADGVDRFVRFEPNGALISLSNAPRTKTFLCREDEEVRQDRLQVFLRPGEGYIDRGKTGGGFSRENASLHRPDGSNVKLPMLGGEINFALYVHHLGKYLLNDTDNLSGHIQPLGRPVFYLMTPEGQVTEIPQPKQFVDTVGGFGEMRLMRDGMLLNRTGPAKKNAGLFLLTSDRLIRLFGADGTIATRLTPSPDGCTLAFLGLKNYDFSTKKTVRVINLCGGE